MQRQLVSSSRMRSVGWENETLEIEFNDGTVYQYHGVPYSAYLEFMNSPSLGSALHRLDKIYPYNRV